MHENAVWAPTKKQVKKIKKGEAKETQQVEGAMRRGGAKKERRARKGAAERKGGQKSWVTEKSGKKEKRQTGREWKPLKLQRGGLVLLDLRWKASRLEKPKAEGLGEITSSKARL